MPPPSRRRGSPASATRGRDPSPDGYGPALGVPNHPRYEGALACGIGAELGALSGEALGGFSAFLFYELTVGNAQNANLPPSSVAILIAFMTVGATAGAAVGCALAGDPKHPIASAVAGGIGAFASAAVEIGVLVGVFTLSSVAPNPVAPFVVVGANVASAVVVLAGPGVTAGVLAPLLAGDPTGE